MYLFDDRDNSRRHFGGDGHRSALGDLVVELFVKRSGADVESGALKLALLLVLDELFGAVNGIARIVLDECLGDLLFGVLAVNYVGHIVSRGGALEAAARAEDLYVIVRECVDRGNLDINNGLVRRVDDDLGEVVRIAEGQRTAELRVNHACVFVEIKESERKSDGVGTGVVNTARALFLQSLPVPTAGKIIVSDTDLLDLAELTRLRKLVCKGIEGGKEGLLEYSKRYALVLCDLDKLVALVACAAKGLSTSTLKP